MCKHGSCKPWYRACPRTDDVDTRPAVNRTLERACNISQPAVRAPLLGRVRLDYAAQHLLHDAEDAVCFAYLSMGRAGAVKAISDGHSVIDPVTAARHFQRSFTAANGERHPHFVELGWQASCGCGLCLFDPSCVLPVVSGRRQTADAHKLAPVCACCQLVPCLSSMTGTAIILTAPMSTLCAGGCPGGASAVQVPAGLPALAGARGHGPVLRRDPMRRCAGGARRPELCGMGRRHPPHGCFQGAHPSVSITDSTNRHDLDAGAFTINYMVY